MARDDGYIGLHAAQPTLLAVMRVAALVCTAVFGTALAVHSLFFSAPHTVWYDYVVVGGGSTGSIVAGRLGREGYSVLLLESGGVTQHALGSTDAVLGNYTIFDVPLGWVQVLSDHRWRKEFQWDVPADPPPAIARGLGGCGIHNAMLYVRGRPEDFESWGRGWSWDDVLPFYLKTVTVHESNVDSPNASAMAAAAAAAAAAAGDESLSTATGDGPVHVGRVRSDRISRAFVAGCVSAGVPANNDFNGDSRVGAGAYHVMIRDGVRDSPTAAFLGRSVRPQTVTVAINALVTKLVFDANKTISAVEFVRGHAPTASAPHVRVRVREEVILSAGAVNTPKVLLLSGIGDRRDLDQLGIESVHHNPNVGKALTDGVYGIMQWVTQGGDYVRCRLNAGYGLFDPIEARDSNSGGANGGVVATIDATSRDTSASLSSSLTGAASEGSVTQYCREQHERYSRGLDSVFANPGMSVGAFLRSPYAVGNEPDIQLTLHPWDKYSRTWPNRYQSIASLEIANNRPRSRGHVSLRSARFWDPPVFQGPYLLDRNDSLPVQWAMRQMRRIVRTPPMRRHFIQELVPGDHVESEGALNDAIACGPQQFRALGRPVCDRSELPVNHLAGTCRLGDPEDPRAVVDRRLRVIGVHGVRVADASVMPRAPSGNTHATCMMIGERASSFIIEEREQREERRRRRERRELRS